MHNLPLQLTFFMLCIEIIKQLTKGMFTQLTIKEFNDVCKVHAVAKNNISV